MKLSFDASVEAFRQDFLEWFRENRPTPEEMAAEPRQSSAHLPGWAKAWVRRQFEAGWLVPGWPKELGGRNAGAVETLVYQEELKKADVPRTTNPQGLGIIAPSILDFGSPEQIEKYAMPVLRGERTACLGMSEPGAGSDLASLSTRAVLDGDHFVINGQKVWTSGAAWADFCFLFCRTDPTVPKHKGISIILVEMDTPGLTVRPIEEIVDRHHPDLAEVFLTDVIVPKENLVGEMNNGWAMASGSLAHERGMVWLDGVMLLEAMTRDAIAQAPAALAAKHPTERGALTDVLMQSYIDSVAARCLGYRGFAKLVRGGNAPEQALMKWFDSESRQKLAERMAEVLGETSLDYDPQPGGYMRGEGSWLELYFRTFASTISAGSSEIQRNIIAEKVLGLPRG
jgi:alkylation response protein AidB-like acyl-CoA dehydrogenase